jgi:hypothetical protein
MLTIQYVKIVPQQYLNKKLDMIQKVIFTKEECHEIIKFFKEKEKNVKMPAGQTRVNYKGYLLPNEDGKNLLEKLYKFFEDETGLKLNKFPKENYFMQYTEGDVFSQHTDEYGERVWIIGLQLSEESEYEGADFIFYTENENILIDKSVGNCFITKANVSHEVKKLTKGNRYSFVSFPDQTSLQTKKTLF